MQVLWASGGAVTSNYILKELQGLRKWQLSTLMTSLSRLVDKGYLSCDRATGTNLYSPVVTENDYKAKESGSFLEKLYHNSLQSMVATLYHNQMLNSADVEELRTFLDELEKNEEGKG